MYILKNAIKSITRTKARNILIGIIIIVITISSCVALSIKNSAENLVESYENENEIEAEITVNRDNLKGNFRKTNEENKVSMSDYINNVQRLDVETVKKYGDSEYVKNYYYTIKAQLNSSNISKATIEENKSQDINIPNGNMKPKGNEVETYKASGDFTVVGYSDLNAMKEFTEGTYKITSGTVFDFDSNEKQCVISEDLAEENSLEIGSIITLVNPNNESYSYEFTVVGVYSDSSENEEFTMFSNSANQILTTYSALNEVYIKSSENSDSNLDLQTDAKFILTNKDTIESFNLELKTKGLSENYMVTTNLETLENNLQPIKNLSTFVTTFLIIVLVIGGVILIVISMINIRERKYEIGVLRSIGMKKYKVLFQFIIELGIVTFTSIVIGTIIGAFLTVPVSKAMLKSEIESAKTSQETINNNFGMNMQDKMQNNFRENVGDIRNKLGSENANYVDEFNAVINIKTILELMGIGVLLTIISSCISMVFISRYSPLKILNSRT